MGTGVTLTPPFDGDVGIVLTVAIFLPFVSMTKLGTERVFSLVGGIMELFRGGQTFIGVVLFVFSVIFPYAKLVALLVATSSLVPLSTTARRRCRFGLNRRFVTLWAWLTRLPNWGPLPQMSHR